jgi:hypothetical protein
MDRLVIIEFDRLPASSLGCYGSFTVPTSNWDLLAAQGVVFDHCYLVPEATDSERMIPLRLSSEQELVSSFKQLRRRLKTAEAGPVWCAVDSEVGSVENAASAGSLLDVHFETVIQGDLLLGNIAEILADIDPGIGLVVTARGGDARALRTRHPDWLASICEERVHVPLLVVLDGIPASRSPRLLDRSLRQRFLDEVFSISSEELNTVLTSWRSPGAEDYLLLKSELAEAIRTNDWYLVRELPPAGAGTEPELRLFAKPEDRWEQLDVAAQYPAVVDSLLEMAGW